MGYTLDIHYKERQMVTKLQKWGNSQGLRVPKEVLEEVQIEVGDEVKISVQRGRIVVESTSKVRGRYNLKSLVAKIPKGYRVEELDWGQPTGKETW
jgi:antitoxin MazE